MFNRHDPNADLAAQQAIFGTRAAPPESTMERLKARLFGKISKPTPEAEEKHGPMGDIIRNALFSDIPEIAADFPILSNPTKDQKLPEKFIIISLVDDDPDAVQIELVAPHIIEARSELLKITTKLEKGQTHQAQMEGLHLRSDRMIVHKPTLPEVQAAICRVMPGRKPVLFT